MLQRNQDCFVVMNIKSPYFTPIKLATIYSPFYTISVKYRIINLFKLIFIMCTHERE